jgi:hypothetical protein
LEVTTYGFSFKPGTTGNIGAIKFQLCDSPLEIDPCVNTGTSLGFSFTSNSASIQSQSGISGFGVGSGTPPAPTVNAFWVTNGTPQNITSSTTVTVTLQNVRNPSVANQQFYGRITTYSDSAGTAEVDYGAVGISTAQTVTITGTMPESLSFCVGTSGTDCTNMTGSTLDLGTFSPAATNSGTSLMSAGTNAGFGYAISVVAPIFASGANTISSMGTQSLNSSGCAVSCTDTIGSSQFGVNLRANGTPSVGSNVTGLGGGTAFNGYSNVNTYRFFTGDEVASAAGPTKNNLYTTSYIVNVSPDQAAGLYTTTMTYICTATF